MTKPPSIARFEMLYWPAVVLGWLNSALNWRTSQAALDANPMLANVHWFLPVSAAVGALISIAIWFFIARKASVVAKWVQVVFAALGAIGILTGIYTLVSGKAPSALAVVVVIVANVLYVAAATMLFKPDAKEWFGEGLDEDDSETLA
ncbi:hypothetical protein D9601_14800 [Sphingomonas sp. MA1305]|uniref:hypothetical protein n=1 Tax=Sphingomonas sp. MA1305 TaxID=2479204 RepID=UPI0018E024DA|nr:hypothetical protein [Sphingomonas sp. MA1305]MBI0476617.1 hypothetical protein [Sphingomonas sp. MA1305]